MGVAQLHKSEVEQPERPRRLRQLLPGRLEVVHQGDRQAHCERVSARLGGLQRRQAARRSGTTGFFPAGLRRPGAASTSPWARTSIAINARKAGTS